MISCFLGIMIGSISVNFNHMQDSTTEQAAQTINFNLKDIISTQGLNKKQLVSRKLRVNKTMKNLTETEKAYHILLQDPIYNVLQELHEEKNSLFKQIVNKID